MLTKLRLSLTKQIEDIEQSLIVMVIMYSMLGYMSVAVVALPLNAYRNGTLNGHQIFMSILAACLLLFFYYTRYRMIVDDKNDGN